MPKRKVSKKQRPPAIDHERIDRRLKRAQSELCEVKIKRWIPGSDAPRGFVVATSETWVLLAYVSDRIWFDGWKAIRREDIQAVVRFPRKGSFVVKALKARGQWPPSAPGAVAIESTATLLEGAKSCGPMVAVSRDFERPDINYVGAVHAIHGGELSMLEVTTGGIWFKRPTLFDLDDITEINFGGGYEEALALVAGPMPTKFRLRS